MNAEVSGQHIRMQQCIMESSGMHFERKLNELLMDGWRYVPGSFSVSCTQEPAIETTPAKYRMPNGLTFRRHYFCVIERDEAPADPAVLASIGG